MGCSRRCGMGALELLGALGVLLVTAFGFYYYVNMRTEAAKRTLTIQRLQLIETGLEKYCLDCGGAIPTQKQGLEALLKAPQRPPIPRNWAGPYLTDLDTVRDAWGRPFKYVFPGRPIEVGSNIMRPYDLASYGRDGVEGGSGLDRDICNWDRSTLIP